MTPNPITTKMSPDVFLEFERAADEKHEYRDGEVVLMSGARRAHKLIAINVGSGLHGALKNKDCETYMSDMRVYVPSARLYTYPDIVVVCGDPKFIDDEFDTLTNPILLIEILSESTESYDRGQKFKHYRSIDSLREYVLISQQSPSIEKYVKHGDGFWMLSDAAGLDSSLTLETIDCRLSLADVYDKVTFAAERS